MVRLDIHRGRAARRDVYGRVPLRLRRRFVEARNVVVHDSEHSGRHDVRRGERDHADVHVVRQQHVQVASDGAEDPNGASVYEEVRGDAIHSGVSPSDVAALEEARVVPVRAHAQLDPLVYHALRHGDGGHDAAAHPHPGTPRRRSREVVARYATDRSVAYLQHDAHRTRRGRHFGGLAFYVGGRAPPSTLGAVLELLRPQLARKRYGVFGRNVVVSVWRGRLQPGVPHDLLQEEHAAREPERVQLLAPVLGPHVLVRRKPVVVVCRLIQRRLPSRRRPNLTPPVFVFGSDEQRAVRGIPLELVDNAKRTAQVGAVPLLQRAVTYGAYAPQSGLEGGVICAGICACLKRIHETLDFSKVGSERGVAGAHNVVVHDEMLVERLDLVDVQESVNEARAAELKF